MMRPTRTAKWFRSRTLSLLSALLVLCLVTHSRPDARPYASGAVSASSPSSAEVEAAPSPAQAPTDSVLGLARAPVRSLARAKKIPFHPAALPPGQVGSFTLTQSPSLTATPLGAYSLVFIYRPQGRAPPLHA